jgi:predicted phage tail protein
MIRTVHLHGALGQYFAPSYRIDVSSCAEAIRALCAMVPDFQAALSDGSYRLFRGAESKDSQTAEDELHFGLSDDVSEIHLVPVAAGAKDDGIGKIILGTILIAAAFVIPGSATIFGESVGAMVGQAGVAVVLGGVVSLLSPDPPALGDQERSELFSGSVNRATPGAGIPVVFGEYEAPIKIISTAIHLEDMAEVGQPHNQTGVFGFASGTTGEHSP